MLGVNESWVTIIYADSYFSKKYGASFWASLILNEKEQLAVTSKNFILSMGYDIADTNTTDKVKKAQCETIQFIYEYYAQWKKRANLTAAGVTNFSVLNFSESLSKQVLPVYIKNLIADYFDNHATEIGVIEREINI